MRLNQKARDYQKANLERRREYLRKRKEEPLFALAGRVRGNLLAAMRRNGFKKTSKTAEVLGCSWEDFKIYMESLFEPGMTWEQSKDWSIDHVIPVASAATPEEVVSLGHYSNLMPVWNIVNFAKKDKNAADFYGDRWPEIQSRLAAARALIEKP